MFLMVEADTGVCWQTERTILDKNFGGNASLGWATSEKES
jgi:hypothetical protein